MKGITATTRYNELVNRLYAYGHGSKRSTRLNLIDAGEANEYIDDAASIAAYGVHCGTMQDSSIEDATELLAQAQTALEKTKDPRVEYTLDVIDLSQSALKALAYEQIYLGSPRRIFDQKLGISTLQNVVQIVRSLKNPLDVKITLANIPRNLTAFWKKTIRDIQELQTADAVSPFTDEEAFGEALESTLSVTDATTDIATWDAAAGDGTLDDLMEDMIGCADAENDICHWNDAAETGNLDTHIADMLNHDPTPVLTNNAPEDCTTGAAEVGTGTRAAREDHKHHYEDTGSPLSNDTPLADSSTGNAGTSTDVSRSDHQHPIPVYT